MSEQIYESLDAVFKLAYRQGRRIEELERRVLELERRLNEHYTYSIRPPERPLIKVSDPADPIGGAVRCEQVGRTPLDAPSIEGKEDDNDEPLQSIEFL